MLQLKDIYKQYQAGDQTVPALRGVSLSFRKSEFVCVLGPSGCGKTTLLNIIGGLDQYSSGDLIINGRSTKDYSVLREGFVAECTAVRVEGNAQVRRAALAEDHLERVDKAEDGRRVLPLRVYARVLYKSIISTINQRVSVK